MSWRQGHQNWCKLAEVIILNNLTEIVAKKKTKASWDKNNVSSISLNIYVKSK